MEVHPKVLAMMQRAARSPEQLEQWLSHHATVTEQDVQEDLDRIELDDYLDVVGWQG